MINTIYNRIEKYISGDYAELINISEMFLEMVSGDVKTKDEYKMGLLLFRELTMLSVARKSEEFKSDFELNRKIKHARIKIFKACIPASHSKLRGQTELLMGMHENKLG